MSKTSTTITIQIAIHRRVRCRPMSRFIVLAVLLAAQAACITNAIDITIRNNCRHPITIYGNNKKACELRPPTSRITYQASWCKLTLPRFVMYRDKPIGESATGIQFATSGNILSYSIDTIPPGATNCSSYASCKAQTGKSGFDVAVRVKPLHGLNNATCSEVRCQKEGCVDAYHFHGQDVKPHHCRIDTDTEFYIGFCL